MANTYSISLEGSQESLHKQVVLQEYCATVEKNVLTQHYKNVKQIGDVPPPLINEALALANLRTIVSQGRVSTSGRNRNVLFCCI